MSKVKVVLLIALIVVLSASVTRAFLINENQAKDLETEESIEELEKEVAKLRAELESRDKSEFISTNQEILDSLESKVSVEDLQEVQNNLKKLKVGYVNLDLLVQNHSSIIASKEKLEAKAEQIEGEYLNQIKDLDPKQDGQKIQKLQQKYQAKISNLKVETEVLEEVLTDIEIARKNLGYDLMLDSAIVVGGATDITDKVSNYLSN